MEPPAWRVSPFTSPILQSFFRRRPPTVYGRLAHRRLRRKHRLRSFSTRFKAWTSAQCLDTRLPTHDAKALSHHCVCATMSHSLISYPCTVCCKATSMWCSRCQGVWYCSPDHLYSDWARHKKECVPTRQGMQYSGAVPPPLQTKPVDVSAVLFLPEEDRARIVVVKCQVGNPAVDGMCPAPLVHPYFPAGRPESVVLTQGLNNETLRFPLQVFYCPTSISVRAPINRAIARVTAGKAVRPWCGPVLVLKYSGSRKTGYMDAGSNDLPALSAYFLAYK